MTLLIIIACICAYLAGWVACARWLYAGWRPSTVTICGINHHHDYMCARRPGLIMGGTAASDSNGEAAVYALFCALLWPVPAIIVALRAIITAGAPELPAERSYREKQEAAARKQELADLDRELEKSRKALANTRREQGEPG